MEEKPQTIDMRRIINAIALIGMTCFSGMYLIGIIIIFLNDPGLLKILYEHLKVFLGIPLAAMAAFCIVIVLEAQTGKIEIEGLGFKFKGASGPVILWIFSFLAISAAINLLW